MALRGPAEGRARRRPAAQPGVAARATALALVAAVLDERRPLDAALEDGTGGLLSLAPRDRALARAITGTALRRHGEIAAALRTLIDRRPPRRSGRLRHILTIGAAQLLFLDLPDHAVVATAMELAGADPGARHFKTLVNGVLRRIAREKESLRAADPARINTPDWLWQRWSDAYGADDAERIATAHLVEPPLDLTVREDAAGWAERLGGTVLPNGSIRLVPSGPIEALSGFAEGAWLVQDAAAALPATLLGATPGMTVADLCAAPGGKTAQLALAGASVTAIDQSAGRLERLGANLARLGLTAEAIAADLLDWQPDRRFDAVLLDAPCSATGTIRRHPDVAHLKTAQDIAALAELQARLLDRAAALVRPGGTLLYCTCSLEPEEGERQTERALATLPLEPLPVAAAETAGLGRAAPQGAWRTLPFDLPAAEPRLAGLAGFYIARFRRL